MAKQLSVKHLKMKLGEKEELIAALTERLELAADQLDRYQRNGDNSAPRASSQGSSSQESEERAMLLKELQQLREGQEGDDSGVTLEQISTQITELHHFVANTQSVTQSSSLTATATEEEQDLGESLSAWAAIKSDILSGEAEPSSSSSDDDASDEQVSGQTTKESPPEEIVQKEIAHIPEISWASLTLPEETDFEQADFGTLQQAIESRDQYISYLVQKLRIAETTGLPKDWSTIDAPKELQQRLGQLATRLEETLRLSEVEISMERARLSRESIRLQLVEQRISKELKKLGISHQEDEIDWDRFEEEKSGQGSRWRRLLGMGSDD